MSTFYESCMMVGMQLNKEKEMAYVTSLESILLAIHTDLGLAGSRKLSTKKKTKFANGELGLNNMVSTTSELVADIFDTLGLDAAAQSDLAKNVWDFMQFNKQVELYTWSFDADARQILWLFLSHSYIPGVARNFAFWNLEDQFDEGMPGGEFWFLPQVQYEGENRRLSLPVNHVCNWLLELMGTSIEKGVNEASDIGRLEDMKDSIVRTLHNWHKTSKLPNASKINELFNDDLKLSFKGTFIDDPELTFIERLNNAREFIGKKGLTAAELQYQIPMSEKTISAAIQGHCTKEIQLSLIENLSKRYAMPNAALIRKRFLIARLVQNGYQKLLKKLLPGIEPTNTDPAANKLLQLCEMFKYVYNLTINAYRACGHLGEDSENQWFESKLPVSTKHTVFRSILRSRPENAAQDVGKRFTRLCHDAPTPDAPLEDIWPYDDLSQANLIKREVPRLKTWTEEYVLQCDVIEKIKNKSPWHILKEVDNFWMLSQVYHSDDLSSKARLAVLERLTQVSVTSSEKLSTNMLWLDFYLNRDGKHHDKTTIEKVSKLLASSEEHPEHHQWTAPLAQYKAKHLLAQNDFKGAVSCFKQAFDACKLTMYGSLRGEIARDLFAAQVAETWVCPVKHEQYLREMLNYGVITGSFVAEIPSVENVGRELAQFFWDTLYKPYPGIPRKQPLADDLKKSIEQMLKFIDEAQLTELDKWCVTNKKLLSKRLPYVQGDSVLLAWMKMFANLKHAYNQLPAFGVSHSDPNTLRMQEHLGRLRGAIMRLVELAPQQLEISDFKRQMPLMIAAGWGDVELMEVMLKNGASVNDAEYQGKTALHSAVSIDAKSCVELLLTYGADPSMVTVDGNTPLHTAALSGSVSIARMLINSAPQTGNIVNEQGMTPFDRVEALIESSQYYLQASSYMETQGKALASRQDLEKFLELRHLVPDENTVH